MCQESFNRAVIQANQFLKHDMVAEAKKALQNARRYDDCLLANGVIIVSIQNRILEKEEKTKVIAAGSDGIWQCGYCKKWVGRNIPHDFDPHEKGIDNGN